MDDLQSEGCEEHAADRGKTTVWVGPAEDRDDDDEQHIGGSVVRRGGGGKQQQLLVGFALEIENELENARGKLVRKNLDAIVLNSLRDKGAGFSGDTNQVTFIYRKHLEGLWLAMW